MHDVVLLCITFTQDVWLRATSDIRTESLVKTVIDVHIFFVLTDNQYNSVFAAKDI